MFAQGLDLHHMLYKRINAKYRRKTFDLVQQTVGPAHIVCVEQILDQADVRGEGFMQSFEQGQKAGFVTNELHPPLHRQVSKIGWCGHSHDVSSG
jgi:hypothetical protein